MGLSAAVLAGVERSLAPLDAARRALYRAFVPWLGPWIRDRDVRVGLHGASVVLGSLVGAVLAPLWLLALGPVLLGVPHLVADLRYLVARPGLHRRRGALVIGALVALSSALVDLRIGLVGAALAPLFARAPLARRLAAAVPFFALAGVALVAVRPAHVALAHAHNLVAVAVWLALSAAVHGHATGLARGVTATGFGIALAAILGGAFDTVALTGLGIPGGPSLAYHVASLAPGLDPVWATRWVVAFAFAQSVHYGLWLRVIPEEARPRPSPRSWKASLRALRADLGDPVLVVAIALTVGFAIWGLFDLGASRAGYLRLALFHGPLELSVLGLLLAEGREALRPETP
ncbi:MAG: hypothetical protein H6737_21070 [Alphaproteobacteria bacterium]|nr:hypothetical protein [Alphaproteobacteria bacterium]